MQVPPFVRRSFVKPTDEDRRPQFVAGEFKNSAASGPVDVDVATGCAGYRVDVRSDAVSR
jgi:hypothetical protein